VTGARTSKNRPASIYTIGYEGRSVAELVQRLRASRVDVLVDVRENASSRKPGFGKRQLSEALDAAGIEYVHEPGLGNPRDNRTAFRNGASIAARQRYVKHLNNGSRAAFDAVIALSCKRRVALMCFERNEAECHRSCIVEQAQAENPLLSVTRL
jgi:uncharacterized protein (DUF488 family)